MELFHSQPSSPKLLIADDDPCVLRAITERCKLMGFDVDTASSGLQVLIKASERLGAQYLRKGPNFWSDLESALAEFHPRMVSGSQQPMLPLPEVRSRPSVLLVRPIHGHAGVAEIVSKSEPDMLFAALTRFCGFESGVPE